MKIRVCETEDLKRLHVARVPNDAFGGAADETLCGKPIWNMPALVSPMSKKPCRRCARVMFYGREWSLL